ncbi:hypothetical protein DFP73DRAFT_561060 [Morchella snyderi]|nr:hypothetical protein DFP73DRAFT_561060 [Morchella snyderi]
MSLYYVYMRWFSKANQGSGSGGRQLLTCESRYVADEFFRACQDLKDNRGHPRFTRLERSAPQFWIYDTADEQPWTALVDILNKSPLPASVEGKVMSILLNDGMYRDWSIAPVVPGRDWVNGNMYFVRNIRQPDLYWFDNGAGQLYLSNGGHKTKFRVVGTDLGSDKRVLIRSDFVRLEVPQTNDSPTKHIRSEGNNRLACTTAGGGDWKFKFGDLLGKFGTRWIGRDALGIHGAVTWGEGEDQADEWELC